MKAARGIGALSSLGFELAREDAGLIAVAEKIGHDGFEILPLAAALGKGTAGNGLGVDDVEVEGGRRFLSFRGGGSTPSEGGQGTANEGGIKFIEEAHGIAFVGSKGEKGGDFVWVRSGAAFAVDGSVGRQHFALALQCLNAPHGDDRSGPVAHHRESYGFLSRQAPGVGIGAEGREFSAKGNHLGQGGRAIGVGDVAPFSRLHDVAAAPQVVEGVVDGDLADTEFICQFDAAIDGAVSDALTEFAVGIPDFRPFEARGDDFDFGTWNTTTGCGAEKVIEMEGLESVVGANAMAGGFSGELGALSGLSSGVATGLVGGRNELVVSFAGDGQKVGHGGGGKREAKLSDNSSLDWVCSLSLGFFFDGAS